MRGIFGAGCFWGAEAAFGSIEGVTQTQVGYWGVDSTECVLVYFEDCILIWEKLLEIYANYWNSVSGSNNSFYTIEPRYKGFVAIEGVNGHLIHEKLDIFKMIHPIRVEPEFECAMKQLKPAQEHQQLYYLRKHAVLMDYVMQSQQIKPSLGTKLNAFVAGNGTLLDLELKKEWFDLPPKLWDYLYRVCLRYDALRG